MRSPTTAVMVYTKIEGVPLLSTEPRIFFLPLASRVAYLFILYELCEEFGHIVHSIALLKSLKHTVDLVCVIGCC